MDAEETSEVSTHVHLVQFDELGSDGTSVGWNYVAVRDAGADVRLPLVRRPAAATVFFHDHQYANLHQRRACSRP